MGEPGEFLRDIPLGSDVIGIRAEIGKNKQFQQQNFYTFWMYGFCIDLVCVQKASRYFVVNNYGNQVVHVASAYAAWAFSMGKT